MDVLVIGAGPYGLATAAAARAAGLETVILGRPMGFWRDHMPPGMFLRSGPDWHLDPLYEHTLERFLAGDVPDPLPLRRFLDYAEWFQAQKGLVVRDERVTALERLTAYSPVDAQLTGRGEPLEVPALEVSPDFFATLGVAPAIGRVIADGVTTGEAEEWTSALSPSRFADGTLTPELQVV